MGPSTTVTPSVPLLSRSHISSLILSGSLIVIHRSLVYSIPKSWLSHHPGGDLAILHFVGRDATEEIEAFHCPATIEVRMKKWVIGRWKEEDENEDQEPEVEGKQEIEGWMPFRPPIQIGKWPIPEDDVEKSKFICLSDITIPPTEVPHELTSFQHQLHLSRSFRRLRRKVLQSKLLSPPSIFCGYESDIIRQSILCALFLYFYFIPTFMEQHKILSYWISSIFLGLFWHQITFVAHDAGHLGLTGDWWTDRLAGITIANFIGGLSIAWWVNNHNVHHLVTNHPEHDPDIQHLPFFAISNVFFKNLKTTYYKRVMEFDAFARFMVRRQLYYIVLSLARLNLFAQSYIFLANWKTPAQPLKTMKRLEITGILFFWTWFGWGILGHIEGSWKVKLMYLLTCCIVASPVHVQIVLSHFSRSTADLGLFESFPHRQLRTTMDVLCPPYLDFLHGGLHMQVSHHLFPRIPRHNLRKVNQMVRDWCEKEGVEYCEMRFVEGNRSVLGVLGDVAEQVKGLGMVAEGMAKGTVETH